MGHKLLVLTLLASISHASHAILPRDDYIDTVCSPNITVTSSDTVIPPCIEIQTIQEICTPNGTTPLYYAAHAQCMCTGSFFEDWAGCQDCLFYHGQRSERDEAFYESIAAAASHSLCDFLSSTSGGAPTPTTDFAGYFSEAGVSATQPTTGATVSSDQAPSSTAVSLYFTLTGSQGPGAITGSAAEATATATTTAGASVTGSSRTSGSGSGSTSTASGNTGSASSSGASSSSSAAAAQISPVVGGLLFGVAGLAVVAGL